MLTTVQRKLAALKLELLKEARELPQAHVDQVNVAVAHLNDAAQIIQGVCMQVEPETAVMDTDRVAERQELDELRAQVAELRNRSRTQPEEPPEPEPPDFAVPTKDPEAAKAEQARAAGRQEQENAREGDPAEQGWG